MSRPKKALSPEQVRQRLHMQGVTVTQWAAAHGYNRDDVYRVLGGQSKARFGRGHDIAVALGMKLADDQPTTPTAGGNPQTAAVA